MWISKNSLNKKNYYRSILKNEDMHFLAKNLDLSESYNRIDKYDIIASSYSTLAYEAFSRGSKTCFFPFQIT